MKEAGTVTKADRGHCAVHPELCRCVWRERDRERERRRQTDREKKERESWVRGKEEEEGD